MLADTGSCFRFVFADGEGVEGALGILLFTKRQQLPDGSLEQAQSLLCRSLRSLRFPLKTHYIFFLHKPFFFPAGFKNEQEKVWIFSIFLIVERENEQIRKWVI